MHTTKVLKLYNGEIKYKIFEKLRIFNFFFLKTIGIIRGKFDQLDKFIRKSINKPKIGLLPKKISRNNTNCIIV